MDSISVLRYCARVLAEREATDSDRRWQWTIRRKLVTWALSRIPSARLRVTGETALSTEERRQIDATHPWLQPIVPIMHPIHPITPAENVPQPAIAHRVERYLSAIRQRAVGLIPTDGCSPR